jgi:LysM repeat protein
VDEDVEVTSSSNSNLQRYKVNKGDTISEIAEKYKVSTRMIRKWNGLRSNKIYAGQTLKIYSNHSVVTSTDDYSEENSANVNYYKVRTGDTIGKISELYKVSSSDIRQWNDLSGDKIVAGQTLKIYSDAGPNPIPPKSNEQKNLVKSSNTEYYTVKKGDTIWDIAKLYDVQVAQIKKWNDMSSNKIMAGQTLKLYSDKSITPTNTVTKNSTGQKTHLVKKGETISRIAETYKVSINDIRQWNNLKDDNIIAGQSLVIKSGSTTQLLNMNTGSKFHIVAAGESLYAIAKMYNTTITKLKSLNNLAGSHIETGQKLRVI